MTRGVMRMFIIVFVTVALFAIPAAFILGGPVGGMLAFAVSVVVLPPITVLAIWKLYRMYRAQPSRSIASRIGLFLLLICALTVMTMSLIGAYVLVTAL